MAMTSCQVSDDGQPTPTARGRWRARYDLALLRLDLAEKGWTQRDLARVIQRPPAVVCRFLCGHHASPKLASQIARALRRSVSRYVLGVEPRRPR